MPIKAMRFVAVMLAALTLGFSLGHLMQLPARMAWDQYLWVGATVQGGLYGMIDSLGAAVQVGAVLAVLLLAYLLREHKRPGVPAALLAARLFTLALVLWWGLVFPVNIELAKGVDGPVPAD